MASRRGHLAVVQLLLEQGAEPNARDARDWTALHWALNGGSREIAALLIAYGADPAICRQIKLCSGIRQMPIRGAYTNVIDQD